MYMNPLMGANHMSNMAGVEEGLCLINIDARQTHDPTVALSLLDDYKNCIVTIIRTI